LKEEKMKWFFILILPFVLSVPANISSFPYFIGERIKPELEERMSQTSPSELIPVNIILEEQADRARLNELKKDL